MDAKSKARFINSVASGSKIPCPNCNTLNDSDSVFCYMCGTKIGHDESDIQEVEDNQEQIDNEQNVQEVNVQINEPKKEYTPNPVAASSAPAFAPVGSTKAKEIVKTQIAFQPVKPSTEQPAFKMAPPIVEDTVEEISVFAEGLPEWDMVPPQVVVRRKNK